ncbi:ATP-binding protein [Roseivirga pacifica]|uniref:ATP-binding protein n=1 Tax=Roseivirga pacifica TaxID=1267423 RepID=UPI003BAC64B5
MKKRRKNYIPNRKNNPVIQAQKIDKLSEQIDLHGKNIDALTKSHNTHITLLSNFSRHDLKNCIQSIDSIINTNSCDELTEEHMDSIRLNLNIMRETMSNFSRLVPHNKSGEFELRELLTAVELLNRDSFFDNKITFEKDISNDPEITFHLPFQSVLQMINNIIINAIKSFSEGDTKNRKIRIEAENDNENFWLKIYDSGLPVKESIKKRIFEYGVSTTGGSGIGLYHAKYLCDLYDGMIEHFVLDEKNEFNKFFKITLPLQKPEL